MKRIALLLSCLGIATVTSAAAGAAGPTGAADTPSFTKDVAPILYYELQTPKKIPAGSKVTVVTLFDNSPKNRYNPSPEKEVYWSEQSWDEMYAPQARITVDSRDLKKAGLVTGQQRQQ